MSSLSPHSSGSHAPSPRPLFQGVLDFASPSAPSPSDSTCAWVNTSFLEYSASPSSSAQAVTNGPEESPSAHVALVGSPDEGGDQLFLLSLLTALATPAMKTCPVSAPVTPVSPELQYPDSVLFTPAPEPEEEVPDSTSSSPLYHVRSPMPEPLVQASPAPSAAVSLQHAASSDLGLPPVLALSLAGRSPSVQPAPPLDPYAPPPCHLGPQDLHPHQYHIVAVGEREVWRLVEEVNRHSTLNFPSASFLHRSFPAFPSVTPFWGSVHHRGTIFPSDPVQAQFLNIGNLPICAIVARTPLTPEMPFGYLVFSFRHSLKFLACRPAFIHACYQGAVVISDIYDFLDRRTVFCYGRIYFADDHVYIRDLAYHPEDLLHSAPHLFCYCLTPASLVIPLLMSPCTPRTFPFEHLLVVYSQ